MATRGKSRKVHVTYGDSKRVIAYSKGEKVQKLRHHFKRAFSDVLSDDVAPANVKFQRYDDSFQDYEDIAHDVQLEDKVKLKAIVTQKRGKKVLHLDYLTTKKKPCIFKRYVILLYNRTGQGRCFYLF